MNIFDMIVAIALVIAVIAGWRAGFLRSLATLLAYVAAAPVAVLYGPTLNGMLTGKFDRPPDEAWLGITIVFLGSGILFGALARFSLDEIIGSDISIPDHLLGATLGAARVGLLAVLMVLVFDRIIPIGREPAWYAESRLRPHLTEAGKLGLRKLPPDIETQLDRIRQLQRR